MKRKKKLEKRKSEKNKIDELNKGKEFKELGESMKKWALSEYIRWKHRIFERNIGQTTFLMITG